MNSVTMVRKLRMNRSPTLNAAPEPAEPLVDEPGVPDAGDRAEPDHHLLVDDQHRDQQQQRPQQAVAVVLPGLRVGGHAAGVVVADHHDQPGPDDGQERDQLALEPAAFGVLVAQPDPAERALDVAEVGVVEDRASGWASCGCLGPRGWSQARSVPAGGGAGGAECRWRRVGRAARRGAGPRRRARRAWSPGVPVAGVGGSAASRRRQSSGRMTSRTSSTVITPSSRRSSSTTGMVIRL